MDKVKLYNKLIYPVKTKKKFLDYLSSQYSGIVIAANAKKIINDDKSYTEIMNSGISYPDGKGVVKALKQKGYKSIKYPGHKLWLDFIDQNQNQKSFFFIGADDDTIKKAIKKLRKIYPNLQILGYRNGFISNEEMSSLKLKLKSLKPDVIFVGSSYPKQEFLIKELFDSYHSLYFGLGGSYNVFTGKVSNVPDWWEKYIGYEALYRLIKDPKKIKRQLSNLKFYYYLKTGRI